jgi:hypothetical protein
MEENNKEEKINNEFKKEDDNESTENKARFFDPFELNFDNEDENNENIE